MAAALFPESRIPIARKAYFSRFPGKDHSNGWERVATPMETTRRTAIACAATIALLLASLTILVQQHAAQGATDPRKLIAEQHTKNRDAHTLVRLASQSFDPAKGVPAAPDHLRTTRTRYWLVQVTYPATKAVREGIRATGAELLGSMPDVTYLVRADEATATRVMAVDGVRWVGVYEPAYKLAPGLQEIEGVKRLRVWSHRGADAKSVVPALRAVSGVKVVEVHRFGAVVDADRRAVAGIARIDDVAWVEHLPQYRLHNANALWVTDTGERDVLGAAAPGRLDGSGQTAAVADTGINYIPDDNGRAQAAFSDCDAAGQCKLADFVQRVPGNTLEAMGTVEPTGTAHRKMAGYFNLDDTDPKARSMEGSWHGTHVSGSVAADYPDTNGGYGTRNREADGIAVGARLTFQDIEAEGGLGGLPAFPYDLFDQVYDLDGDGQYDPLEDARTHNNSYGAIYPLFDDGGGINTDDFIVDHPDMTIVFSASNDGPDAASMAGGPQEAKNVITSCASANGRQPLVSPDSAASFSSHGPTIDGRVKPDVCTPGQINVSPKGGTVDDDHYLQGTSMSGPMLVGLVTLVRQYFWDGWGPTGTQGFSRGTRDLARRHNPSAALVKAVTINSAQRMRGIYTGDDGTNRDQDGMWPSAGQGWGKVELDHSLHFAGDDRALFTVDRPSTPDAGLETGQEVTQFLDVAPGQPVDVHLTWTDPSSLLSAGTPVLVNDLDLVVTAPDGTRYLGNEFTTQTPLLGPGGNPAADVHQSKAGGIPDTANNVEGVRLANPPAGRYKVTVVGSNVQFGPQGYALAASGRLATDTPRVVFDAPKYKPGAKATAYLLGTNLSGATVGDFGRVAASVYKAEKTAAGPSVVVEGAGVRATAPVDSTVPAVSDVQVESVSADLARVTWTSDEDSTGEVVVTGPDGKDATFADVHNVAGFPGLTTPQVETKGVYLNRKAVGTRHEVNVTGLKPGTAYAYSVKATDEAGNSGTGATGRFTSTDGMYQPNAPDMAMLLSGDTTHGLPTNDLPVNNGQAWGTSTQLYAGSFQPLPAALVPALDATPVGRVEAMPAFMFRLPSSVDPKRITGAAVEMHSAHDIVDTFTTETTYSMDLLDSGAESGWGPGKTYSSVKSAAADVELAADPTLRRGANKRYAWHVPCNKLDAFKQNLSEDSGAERRAAFRLTGITNNPESLFSFEFGFGRRSRGPQLRPRLVLFLDGLDPQPCTATAAPAVSNVVVDHTDSTSAVVSWRTDLPADSTVYFRQVGGSTWTPVSAPVRVTQHFVRVEGLKENGPYEFMVQSATCNGLATTDNNGGEYYALYNAAFAPPEIAQVHARPSPDTAGAELIGWSTNQPTDSVVRYGTSPSVLDREVKDNEQTETHALTLPALTPCTRYYFQVISTNGAGKTSSAPVTAFDTPVATPTTVVAYDFQSGTQGWTNSPTDGSGNLGLIVANAATNKTIWQRQADSTFGSFAMRTTIKETGTPGYTSNVDQRLVSPPIAVPAGYSELEWREYYNMEGVQGILESWEEPRVEVSLDNGTTWTALRTGVFSQNPDFPAPTTLRLPLPAEAAGKTVRLAFRLRTDTNTEPPGGGWGIDDVKVLNSNCATLAGVVAGVPVAPQDPGPPPPRVRVGPVVPVAASGGPLGTVPPSTGAPSAASLAAGTCRCGDVRFLGAAVGGGGPAGGGDGAAGGETAVLSASTSAPAGTLPATGGGPSLAALFLLVLAASFRALTRRCAARTPRGGG